MTVTSNTNLKIIASVIRIEVSQINIVMNFNVSVRACVYSRSNTRFLSFGYNLKSLIIFQCVYVKR